MTFHFSGSYFFEQMLIREGIYHESITVSAASLYIVRYQDMIKAGKMA